MRGYLSLNLIFSLQVLNDSLVEIHKLDKVYLNSELYIISGMRIRHRTMKGFSTFTNITDIKAFCTEDGKIIFNTTLRMDDSEFAYQSGKNGLFSLPKTFASMKASILDCTLEIFFKFPGEIGFKVNKCKLSEGADFKIELSSLSGITSLSLNYFKIFREKTESVIEWIMRDFMEVKLLQVVQNNDGLSWS